MMATQIRLDARIGVKITGVSAGAAAVVWLVGLPLIALAGVIPGSDAPYGWMGTIGVLLGLTVAPAAAIGVGRREGALNMFSRAAGLVACAVLAVTGVVLTIGVAGALGERAPSWVAPAAQIAWVAFLIWIVLASFLAHDSSAPGRAMLWLGVAVGVSVFLTIAGSALVFYLNPGFVYTNETILPSLLLALVMWLCPAAWFIVLAIRLWATEPVPEPTSRGEQLIR
ncbi:MAG: hypothetical protein QOE92_603 [Chloroflexota bacterium]|jgi:hypothetical protein|nr:hypothetical protein [Chloroflexota bacterium]